MFLPYGTDAPIYHWPKATVGLIVANVLVFLATAGMPADDRLAYALVRGGGLHPFQWLSSVFMHADAGHLIGNMIFLWAFGIVVEGKLGALRFLPLYLGVGVSQAAFMQILSLRADHGYILGASAAIYGMMAVCLVWAPLNELNCWVFLRFIPNQVDVMILWFALGYIGLEFLMVVLTAGRMSTPFLHLTGAIIGFAFGAVMVKADLVDCENWDLFAVMAGRKGMTSAQAAAFRQKSSRGVATRSEAPAKAKAPRAATASAPGEDPRDAATRRLRRHLDAGEPVAAYSAYDKALRTVAGWQPSGPDWLALIKALLDARESRPAVSVMEDYLRRSDAPAPRVRLKLAQVLIRDQQRPAHALRVLSGFDGAPLPEPLDLTRRQLTNEAERLREEGVLELDGEAW